MWTVAGLEKCTSTVSCRHVIWRRTAVTKTTKLRFQRSCYYRVRLLLGQKWNLCQKNAGFQNKSENLLIAKSFSMTKLEVKQTNNEKNQVNTTRNCNEEVFWRFKSKGKANVVTILALKQQPGKAMKRTKAASKNQNGQTIYGRLSRDDVGESETNNSWKRCCS